MPCIAIKTNGHVCGRTGTQRVAGDIHPEHMELCNQHVAQYMRQYNEAGQVHHVAGRCIKFMTTHRWCPHQALEGHRHCATHQAAIQRKLDREAAEAARELQTRTLFRDQLAVHPLLGWQEGVRAIFNQAEIPVDIRKSAARMYYLHWRVADLDEPVWQHHRPEWRFSLYWRWLIEGAHEADPPNLENPPLWAAAPPAIVIPLGHAQAGMMPHAPPAPRAAARPELARIAEDRQNVHTAAVSRQTNEMEKKLLAVPVPPLQQTELTIIGEWCALNPQVRYGDMLRAQVDIHKWFNTKSCRKTDDNLYKLLLRGVVAKILRSESAEMKSELFKRLREECIESIGMCCEGHISRLCNVFVGFDEAFKPPVSIGEVMQEKMAAIAGADLPVEERLAQARAWFDEHAVPEPDRQGWLAAIESM